MTTSHIAKQNNGYSKNKENRPTREMKRTRKTREKTKEKTKTYK